MKEIENLILSIKKWCSDNSIKYFEGNLNNRESDFEIYIDDSIFEFLEICKSNNITHIIFKTELYSFEDYANELLDEYDDLYEDEPRMEIEDILGESSKYDNFIDNITIYCVHQDIIYESSFTAKWRSKIENKINLVIDKYLELKREEERKRFPNCYEQRDRICNKIASHPDFLRFSTRAEKRRSIIEEVLSEEKIEITERNLKITKFITKPNVLDIFYEKHYDAAVDKINMQIREMKKKGCNKIDIITKLDLTEGLYNKYKENNI